jgi:succinate dehydrogenase/fumarate reductase flavoprotein subunit
MTPSFGVQETDVLVIGGGAGCRAAIESSTSGVQIILLSKYPVENRVQRLLQKLIILAPFGEDDSTEIFFEDIVRGGYRLCDRPLAQRFSEEACDRVKDRNPMASTLKREKTGSFFEWQVQDTIAQGA